MHVLAEKLTGHVRFEEREFFPVIEAAIPQQEQTKLIQALEHTETNPDWQPGR
jgi:hypothetical protein